uniref:T-cell receptor alpha/delta variable 17.0 n=1 Tax=Cyprinus carpio carpio TaxID=630221 RepID=A0A9J8AHJ1_CYPCA
MGFCLLLVLMAFIGGSIQDSITPTSPAIHAMVNEKVTISCKYQYTLSMNNLQWYRRYLNSAPEFLVLIMESGQNQTATPPQPRLTASVNKENKTVNLEIFPADVKDSAAYHCALQPTVGGNACTPYKNLLRNIH